MRTVQTDFLTVHTHAHTLEDWSTTRGHTAAVCSDDFKVAIPQTRDLADARSNEASVEKRTRRTIIGVSWRFV